MSHEPRTALAVILSATEVLLGDESLNEKHKGRVARIERAARDMAELGTVLLVMAREGQAQSAGGCRVAGVVVEAVERHRHLLCVVKRICDRHGWGVRLESGESRGTSVTIEFAKVRA